MDASISQLQSQLNALRSHIEEAARRNSVLELDTTACNDGWKALVEYQAFYKRHRTQHAVFEYSARIVGLYGALERFIENAIVGYLTRLNAVVPTFDELPLKLREGHTEASAQLLSSNHQKYAGINELVVIENMLSCAARATPYNLNVFAYTQHTANFRAEIINEFFSMVGIHGLMNSVRSNKEFRLFLRNRFPPRTNVAQLPLTAPFSPLEEIASRRNEIAHGAPSELIGPDILMDWIDFVGRFGQALVQVLHQELLGAEAKHRATALPAPLAIHNHQIVCFEIDVTNISQGDRILAKSVDGRWVDARVERLEVNHRAMTTVIAPPTVKFAAALSSRVKKNHKFFHIHKEPTST